MRLHLKKRLQRTAQFLLLVMLFNILQPVTAFALTSGPSQPEAMTFQPVGMTDMVDLSTGDFKYNIPLLDVDGYPINLNYQSGSGIDDEASWVGLGWNLNVGSINRQVRGIPDDFNGDMITTEHSVKKKVTVGGRLNTKLELWGSLDEESNITGSFSIGVFSDSYTGIGAEFGANVGMSFGLSNSGNLTAGMGLGVLSNTSSGVDVSPYISLSVQSKVVDKMMADAKLSTSLTYNTRSGIKSFTLSQSYNVTKFFDLAKPGGEAALVGAKIGTGHSTSLLSYNTDPVFPKVQVPFDASYESFTFDAGLTTLGIYKGFGATGYRNVRYVRESPISNSGYGFLYADLGKDQPDALLDFIREKDNPVISELPNLALPVHTPDLFYYNSQKSSGQFRLYRGGTGIFSDNSVVEHARVATAGIELGFGKYVHAGATLFDQASTTKTGKWTKQNSYARNGDFQNWEKNKPLAEPVYFRKTDERTIEDDETTKLFGRNGLASVNISGVSANANLLGPSAFGKIEKKDRNKRQTNISYLTAEEAKVGGLDKKLVSFPFLNDANTPNSWLNGDTVERVDGANIRKKHHISEVTVTDTDNGRLIYGIPVYNTKQEDYSFAIGKKKFGNNEGYELLAGNKNLTTLALNGNGQINHQKGIDEYYHVDKQAPYANSYLLTALLSPDYVDKTSNGISDDDLGSAVKFKYSKIPIYRWRTPYALNDARNTADLASHQKTVTVNRGLLADPDDDKGSIIYGEKEIYYPQSIETKNHIAIFITEDRLDGLGVVDWKGAPDPSIRQKRLTEIRLYSKSGSNKTLVKTVKFRYEYELCPNTPNSIAATKGKLTLKNVWFEYGKTTKGAHHSYAFNYYAGSNYQSMATDRWGTFKPEENNWGGFSNEDFPYSTQDRTAANNNVKAYQLSEITLPSGGKIQVGYESDDYAYVQDKRAATMQPIKSFLKEDGVTATTQLKEMRNMKLGVTEFPPAGVDSTQWFKDYYLAGSNFIYAKTLVTFATNNGLDYGCVDDYISAYSKVKKVIFNQALKEATLILEPLTDRKTASSLQFAAWQKMKNEYPRYAYPGFKNKVGSGDALKAIKAAISAIANAVGNLSELRENFYDKAERKGYASSVNLSKSFVRLTEASGSKLGGGLRVKYIKIADEWQDFTDNTAEKAVYGQWYDYTTTENGKLISSGVASYEPSVGSDENPLRQPVFYSQKIKGGLSNLFELEVPFGESYYPAPSVGYSKVTVRDLQPDDDVEDLGVTELTDIQSITPRTGSIIHEFYTAKDFPVRVTVSDMQKFEPPTAKEYGVLSSNSFSYLVLSQGYRIELNDMHGKAKSQQVLNKGGTAISSVKYNYQVENPKARQLRLKNTVDIIGEDGLVKENQVMGRDIEFFTDFREQEYVNSGKTRTPGLDVISIFGLPVPIPHFYVDENTEYKLFRSAAAVKVVQQFGILQSVVKTENGSSITTENVAYDGLTGEALVTRTQNEFNENIYSVSLPAYWVYKGMGGAYQTAGMLISQLYTGVNGAIQGTYGSYLFTGDEILEVGTSNKYWVVETEGQKRLINEKGEIKKTPYVIKTAKVLRSGYRNLLSEKTASLVSLKNPIIAAGSNKKLILGLDADLQENHILQASTILYDEKWAPVPVAFKMESRPNGDYTQEKYIWAKVNFKDLDKERKWSGSVERIWWFATLEVKFYEGFSSTTPPNFLTASPINWIGNVVFYDRTENEYYSRSFNYNSNSYIYGQHPGNGTISYIAYRFEDHGIFGGRFSQDHQPVIVDVDGNHHGENFVLSSDVNGNPIGPKDNSFSAVVAIIRPQPIYADFQIPFNPYLTGYLGNWKVSEAKVYQENRKNNVQSRGVDLKNTGYLNSFYSYWKNPSNTATGWTIASNTNNWVTSNTVTVYDKHGQEIENRDALGRYTAANFAFRGQLPSAVASNARNREIYSSSFEDPYNDELNETADFKHSYAVYPNGPDGIVLYTNPTGLEGFTSQANSHTGRRSVQLPVEGVFLKTVVHQKESKSEPYYTIDPLSKAFFIKQETAYIYPKGFQPRPGQNYVFSVWVKDGHRDTKDAYVSLLANNQNVPLKCKSIVEGWKLMEGIVKLEGFAPGSNLELKLVPYAGATVYADDLRIHPIEAHMKTYAYNNQTFKLMAELDENNFASFYEYDDEGQLIRVKKETERGIVTLKETRTVLKKRLKPTTP